MGILKSQIGNHKSWWCLWKFGQETEIQIANNINIFTYIMNVITTEITFVRNV